MLIVASGGWVVAADIALGVQIDGADGVCEQVKPLREEKGDC